MARKGAPWLAGLLLAAGIIAAIVAFAPNKNPPRETNAAGSAAPTTTAPKPKTVPLAKETTSVARTFVRTAVARKDLAAAWKISGPTIRGGLTYKEWLTGDIPVVPYPVDTLQVARFKIDWSYADEAALEIALLPKEGASIKPQVFFMRLERIGDSDKKHWVVDYWVPHSAPLVPQSANS